ncbi:MAG: polysaccharide biosynthesis tyrosine autokinase [Oscillospiraceae bacterium]|nr:polysaccharide biosynthesis tyrosine autokinase [Oscillospiraceae bacterium]
MNERTKRHEEPEIEFRRLALAVWAKKWLILLVTLLSALVSFFGTHFLITREYESGAMFYVNNSTISVGDAALSISSGDISASKSLVDSYIVILHTRETLEAVIDYAGVELRYEDLDDMVTAASVNSTEIFQIIVTDTDPYRAEKLANAIAQVLPQRIDQIIDGSTAKIVDAAVLPTKASYPSKLQNTAIGLLLGAAVTVSIIVLRELFDNSLRSEESIGELCRYPILASVPDMSAPDKKYYGQRRAHRSGNAADGQAALVGRNISFAASEAYKLLRTKLQFSFADEKSCHVIGVSSAIPGEGKSLTAVNLACVLAELGKKVLLIDCDLRRPSVQEKLPLQQAPGLSGYLSGQHGLAETFRQIEPEGLQHSFAVLPSGRIPPNPVELLSSTKMAKLLEQLRREYDDIILDLPPIGEVSDALVVSKQLDGFLLVVRQNYCSRNDFADAIRQFEFAEVKILGIVLNSVSDPGKGKYYRNYEKT